MQEDYSVFKIPGFTKSEVRNFETETPDTAMKMPTEPVALRKSGSFAFYDELNQIAEELEKCRLRNSSI